MKRSEVVFICNICGLKAPEPILCVKQGCPTPMLVYGEADKPVMLARAH